MAYEIIFNIYVEMIVYTYTKRVNLCKQQPSASRASPDRCLRPHITLQHQVIANGPARATVGCTPQLTHGTPLHAQPCLNRHKHNECHKRHSTGDSAQCGSVFAVNTGAGEWRPNQINSLRQNGYYINNRKSRRRLNVRVKWCGWRASHTTIVL